MMCVGYLSGGVDACQVGRRGRAAGGWGQAEALTQKGLSPSG